MYDEIDRDVKEEDVESDELISNPLKRIVMVIFSPILTFQSVAAKRSMLDWMLPLGLTLLFSLIVVNAGYDFIRNDQHNAVIQRIEKNTKLTEEQKSAQIEQIEKYLNTAAGFSKIMVNVSTVLGKIIFLVIIALIMQAVTVFVLHGHLTFNDAFSIGALGSMISMVGMIVHIPLIYYFESFSQATLSLGFLFPEDIQETFIVKFIDFDLFSLWYLVVLCIGMSVFAKTSLGKALIPMTVLFVVFRFVATAFSVGLGGIGG